MGVYVFGEPGMLLVKVGVTCAVGGPNEREMSLKRFWRGGEMLYMSPWLATGMDERRAHRLLRSRYWLEGEWFVCGAEIAKAAVRRAIRIGRELSDASHRAHRRSIPQRVKQIMSEARRENRALTAREERLADEAWAKWEAAGGKPRRLKRRR